MSRAGRPVLVGALAGLGSAVLFGASVPITKRLLPEIAPVLLAGLLYLGGGLAVGTVRLLARRRIVEASLGRADLVRVLAIVVLGGVVGPLALVNGLRAVSGVSGALLLNLEGPLTVLIALGLFGEHLGGRAVLGTGLVFAGGCLLAVPGATRGAPRSSAACSSSPSPARPGPWTTTSPRASWGRTPGRWSSPRRWAPARAWCRSAWCSGMPSRRGGVLVATLALGALAYGASVLLDAFALRLLGAAREAAFFATAPFAGALLSVPVLGERLAPVQIAAGLVMVLGVALLVRERHGHEHTHEALEHSHRHVHDAHHQHVPPRGRGSHGAARASAPARPPDPRVTPTSRTPITGTPTDRAGEEGWRSGLPGRQIPLPGARTSVSDRFEADVQRMQRALAAEADRRGRRQARREERRERRAARRGGRRRRPTQRGGPPHRGLGAHRRRHRRGAVLAAVHRGLDVLRGVPEDSSVAGIPRRRPRRSPKPPGSMRGWRGWTSCATSCSQTSGAGRRCSGRLSRSPRTPCRRSVTACTRWNAASGRFRALARPEDDTRLQSERDALQRRLAAEQDAVTRQRLGQALEALEQQRSQRASLLTAASRLEAERTRLLYTLEGLHTQVLAVRSTAEAGQEEAAAERLRQSLDTLSGEVSAVAGALESVQAVDAGAVPSAAAPASDARVPEPDDLARKRRPFPPVRPSRHLRPGSPSRRPRPSARPGAPRVHSGRRSSRTCSAARGCRECAASASTPTTGTSSIPTGSTHH